MSKDIGNKLDQSITENQEPRHRYVMATGYDFLYNDTEIVRSVSRLCFKLGYPVYFVQLCKPNKIFIEFIDATVAKQFSELSNIKYRDCSLTMEWPPKQSEYGNFILDTDPLNECDLEQRELIRQQCLKLK
jgi:hypothetical protein